MTLRFARPAALAAAALALALGACRAEDAPAARRSVADGAVAAPSAAAAWRANPPAGVDLAVAGDSVVVETGPHAILWPATGQELAPPYTVRAVFEKRHGRLHEGYGILFGGSGLEGPEAGQVYSYFLVRGDGSFLVKRRQGAETPVVRDWTQQAALHRDGEAAGRPNELEVRVGEAEVVFRVNGTEVARVPAAELSLRGRAGVRTAHEVSLVVRDWTQQAALHRDGEAAGRPN
ncbi:MAG TPA: hypothetical protein VM890_03200, partial [Longimicrobium sp.]|nr:hypothetical protein [Longimicrobium sp.]